MKIKNFTSLPAKFISVSPNSDDNPLYTRAKLKVFYVGETVDHRLFTDNFSKLLMGSLPYAPVVSYYNTDKDDFEGHAEQQCIYGIVDPMTQPEFVVEEDGTKWAICDVILYTERPDKTGEIAQKIIGHPESLELDPRTVQYKINRDRTGKFVNLEFTYGKFIGVSVLGKDEKPAFAGAQFFDSQNFLKEIKDCTNRGTNMTIVIPNFVSQSWSETERAVADALAKKFNDGYYLVDMYDTYCIVYLWDEKANSSTLMKVPYTCEIKDGTYNVTFGDAIRVHVTYEDMKAQATPVAATQAAAQTAASAPKVETQASAKPETVTPVTTAALLLLHQKTLLLPLLLKLLNQKLLLLLLLRQLLLLTWDVAVEMAEKVTRRKILRKRNPKKTMNPMKAMLRKRINRELALLRMQRTKMCKPIQPAKPHFLTVNSKSLNRIESKLNSRLSTPTQRHLEAK
jgi:hypothetical protein